MKFDTPLAMEKERAEQPQWEGGWGGGGHDERWGGEEWQAWEEYEEEGAMREGGRGRGDGGHRRRDEKEEAEGSLWGEWGEGEGRPNMERRRVDATQGLWIAEKEQECALFALI